MAKEASKAGKASKASNAVTNNTLKVLTENSVALQRVLADLALNLNSLTKELSQLLVLFKEASKTIGEEKAVEGVEKEDKESLLKKLDSLIDQNRTIAKSLLLLESALREKEREKEQSEFKF